MKNQVWYLVGGHRRPGSGPSGSAGCGRCSSPAEATVRPDDFDLARGVELHRHRPWTRSALRCGVRLRTDPATIDVLRYMFGNRVGCRRRRGTRRADGGGATRTVRAHGGAPARGFADGLEVVAPLSVRRHLADIGRGLLRTNA